MVGTQDYLVSLKEFYDAIVNHGSVKVTRQSYDLFTCYVDDRRFFHFQKSIAMKVGKVCYVYFKRAKMNADELERILSPEFDSYLVTIKNIKRKKFTVYAYDSTGRCQYKKTMKYASINMFNGEKRGSQKRKSQGNS